MPVITDFMMFIFNLCLALAGLLLHLVMMWDEWRTEGHDVTLWGYVKAYPSRTSIAVISAIIAIMIFITMKWLNPPAALAAGYMGNSIVENIANRASANVQNKDINPPNIG